MTLGPQATNRRTALRAGVRHECSTAGKQERLETGAVAGTERRQEAGVMDSCVEAETGCKGLNHGLASGKTMCVLQEAKPAGSVSI